MSLDRREQQQLNEIGKNLASLNEIIVELVQVVPSDEPFLGLVRTILRDHSWKLGFQFQGARPDAAWYAEHPDVLEVT